MTNKKSRITTKQLAEICGVSQGTVDRALHGRSGINENTRRLILSAAEKYGYRPNIHARSLCGGKSGIVGIVVFDLYNEYFSEFIMEIQQQLLRFGIFSAVMFSQKDKKHEIECIEYLCDMGIDSLIICPVNDGTDFSKYLQSLKIPVMTVGNKLSGIQRIGADDFKAMSDLCELVINKNYQKIIYFSPALKYSDINIYAQFRRCEGFKSAAQKHSVDFEIVSDIGYFDEICSIPENTAVIASTDYYAMQLLLHHKAARFAIAGFDNTTRYSHGLTTVDCGFKTAAKQAAKIITADTLPIHTVKYIPHKIIDRGSV